MTKKRVSVYMKQEDIDWLAKFPIAESPSGSAVFVMEWIMQEIRKGAVAAFTRLDRDERFMFAGSMNGAEFAPGTFSPRSLARRMGDWMKLDQGRIYDWEEEKINILTAKIADLSPTEALGLFAWSKGWWEQGAENLEKYVDDLSGLLG